MNKTLAALPEQKYQVMGAFFNAYRPKLVGAGFRPPSQAPELSPPDTWDFESTHLAKPLASGSRSMRSAWNEVSDSKYASHYKRQLLVRDFFSQWDEPPLRNVWKKYPWDVLSEAEQRKRFKAWKNGLTGYDVIDASMIQLRETGFMGNRQRMLCASFLAKNLLVNWNLGERYFASQLEDYNLQSNKGNWAWVSGAGFNTRLTDVMSPDLQRRKIDPDGTLAEKFLNNRGKMPIQWEYQETKAKWLSIVT
jgi:deoxyribodipyrimidine photo-lyase